MVFGSKLLVDRSAFIIEGFVGIVFGERVVLGVFMELSFDSRGGIMFVIEFGRFMG